MNDKTPTVSESADGTPPERQILPLTPPATDELHSTSNPQSPVSTVLDFIKQRSRDRLTDQSLQLRVEPSEYKNLLARIQELPELRGFVEDKLRLEYDPFEKDLEIPSMPTTIHERFIAKVSKETEAQLDRIKSGNDEAARFAARIGSVRSADIDLPRFDSDDDIELDLPNIKKVPDEQFQHEEAEDPGVVFEIAKSQNHRKLDKKAWSYIQNSNGNIKAVVGFELGYGKNKEARISMWQPRYLKEGEEELAVLDVEAVIDREVFRSADKSATNATKTLHLPLDVFANSGVPTLESEELVGITITYATLAEFLDEAERIQQLRKRRQQRNIGERSQPHIKKRKRPSTPPDQLSSDREEEFRDAEKKEDERTVIEDTDFEDHSRQRRRIT